MMMFTTKDNWIYDVKGCIRKNILTWILDMKLCPNFYFLLCVIKWTNLKLMGIFKNIIGTDAEIEVIGLNGFVT